jgi:NADH-quinone oxidoreductase subunit M
MLLNMFKIYNKEYRFLTIISILSILSIINWPINISEIDIYIINIIIGYKINISYNYIGLFFSLVLDILIWICIIYERYYIINKNVKTIIIYYIINNIFFSSNDIISISIIYEFQTIPLLLLINNTFNKINIYNKKGIGISNILLILYSIISGLLLYNSFYHIYLLNHINSINHNINILLNNPNHILLSYIILNIMISGAIKLSIFPFHIWLGKVHVEAPTIGSILLAGISLKTGFYIHYLFLYLFVYINNTILYLFIFVLFIGIILNNINIFYQIDTKRWIALYSIIHMNLYYIILFVVIFNLNTYNNIYLIFIINIIIYGMISHSLISGGLFLIIGYIYDITNNKNVFVLNHNILSSYIYFILFLLLLSNSSFPLFVLFIFELLAFIHLSLFNILLTILLLILSCSNLLSSLYIYYKYFTNHYYGSIINSNYYDLLLIILILPILIIIILMGMNLLLPIHFLISYYL